MKMAKGGKRRGMYKGRFCYGNNSFNM